MNRLMYDSCATQDATNRSTAPINYMLDITKYERCGPCHPSVGIVGGNNVSVTNGLRVDVENDLMGRVRPVTKCPTYMYGPDQSTVSQGVEYIKPVHHPRIDSGDVSHLHSCPVFFDRPMLPQVPEFRLPDQCGRF